MEIAAKRSLRNSLLGMQARAVDADGAATRALAVLHVLGYAHPISTDDSCHSLLSQVVVVAQRALAEDLAVEATADDAVPDAPLTAAPVTRDMLTITASLPDMSDLAAL